MGSDFIIAKPRKSPVDPIVLEDEADTEEYHFEEITMDAIIKVLNQTIVHDVDTKQLCFLALLLNYTEEDQVNVGFQSGSSTGKSHIILNVASLFPKEDIQKLGYISQQALFHKHGKLLDTDGNPLMRQAEWVTKGLEHWLEEQDEPQRGEKGDFRDAKKEEKARLKAQWNDIEKVTEVELHQKILIAIDQRDTRIMTVLRPILSHDDKRIVAAIADKDSGGRHKTKTTVLVGYPTFVYLSASMTMDEQERNRLILLSAESSKGKIQDAIRMAGKKLSDRRKWTSDLEDSEARNELMRRVRGVKASNVHQVVIPQERMSKIVDKFLEEHPMVSARLQRDFPRLVGFIKAHALLNLWSREPFGEDSILVNETDIEVGYSLYRTISDANERGITPSLWRFFNEDLKPKLSVDDYIGMTRKEFAELWKEKRNETLGYKRIKQAIHTLESAGLVHQIQNPNDGRQRLIVLIDGYSPEVTQKKKNLPQEQNTLTTEAPTVPKKKPTKMQAFLLKHSIGSGFSPSSNEQSSNVFAKAVDKFFIEEESPGMWRLTEAGREVIA